MGSFLELVTQHAAGGVCGSPARYVTCLLNDNDNLITVFAVPVFAVPVFAVPVQRVQLGSSAARLPGGSMF